MLAHIIIHVGMHKTGTTAIQGALDGYDDGENAYADLKILGNMTPNHGVAIETAFRKEFLKTPHHILHGRSDAEIIKFRDAFLARFNAALLRDRKTLILSGEGIPRIAKDELQGLRKLCLEHAQKVTIVAYIRAPFGFSSSFYQQLCKMGNFPADQSIPQPRYRAKFARFITVFGRENITFIPYDKATLTGGSSVDDFCARFNLRGAVKAQAQANVGLSGDATRLLYILGKRSELNFGQLINKLGLASVVHLLSRDLKGPAFQLPYAAAHDAVDMADVAWMQDITGFDLSDVPPRPDNIGTDFDTAMRQITPESTRKLNEILRKRKVTLAQGATPEDMVLALFESFKRKAAFKVFLKRTYDRVVSRLGRIRR